MRKHRRLIISALLVAALAAVGFLLYYHSQQPPETARLLPEGELIFYANLKPLHLLELTKSAPIQIESEYKDFIDQTGIQFERDLDQVAMSRRDTPDGRDVESTEIVTGRFDPERLRNYLQKLSQQTENYREHTIFVIPHEGHTVRVCILDTARVAVTNMASAGPMHDIVDRAHNPGAGPALLRDYYGHVPVASLAWLIDRISAGSSAPQLPLGFNFDFLENTVAVGSLQYTGDVHLRAGIIARDETAAKNVVQSADSFLALYHSVAQSVGAGGNDPDVKAAIDSIQIQQNKNVAVITATLSERVLRKLVSGNPAQAIVPEASPTPAAPAKPPHRRRRRHRARPTSSPTPPAGPS